MSLRGCRHVVRYIHDKITVIGRYFFQRPLMTRRNRLISKTIRSRLRLSVNRGFWRTDASLAIPGPN